MKKDLKQYFAELAATGWAITKTNGGHMHLCGPRGELVFAPSTPSDWRSFANLKATVKRQTAIKLAA